MDSRIDEIWRHALATAMKPRTRLSCDAWAEANIRLSNRFTAQPGPFRLDKTPFFREPHRWFSDPSIWKIVSRASAQVAKTTWIANCISYAIAEDPGPIMLATSTAENGQSWVERTWHPMVEECPALRALKPTDPHMFKKMEMHFTSCVMNVVGAQSPANAASRPVRYLFLDEVDKMKNATDKEADVLKLFIVRTRSFGHKKKIIMASTPTVPKGNINVEFLSGSQHRYFVNCPHCTGAFYFTFREEEKTGGIKWPDDCRDDEGKWDLEAVKRQTSYQCPHCAEHIAQSNQRRMVSEGAWIATNPKAQKGVVSFHIDTMSSLPWGEVAVLFLTKKDKPGGLQDFYNSDLGLPYERQHGGVNDAAINGIIAASPEYYAPNRRGGDRGLDGENTFKIKLSLKDLFTAKRFMITMSTDVQQIGYWWNHRLWMDDESSFLLDWGEATSEDDLMRLAHRRYDFCDNEPPMEVDTAIIDSGYRAKKEGGVYNFCMKSGGKFVPSKGRGSTQGLYVPVSEGIVATGYGEERTNLIQYRDDMLKDWLYQQTISKRQGPGWFLPRNIDANYRQQLQDEKLIENEDGTSEYEDGGNNHLGDVEKMQFALRELLIRPLVEANRKKKEAAAKKAAQEPYQDEEGQWKRDYVLAR